MADSPDPRIPAHLEVTGLIRRVEAAGGFATVIAKGEREAGTLLVVCCANGGPATAYERLPQPDGRRLWTLSRSEAAEKPGEFGDYVARRRAQDEDLWIVELDIPNAERFIDIVGTGG